MSTTTTLTLHLRESSPIPLEVDGITPERVESLSLLEVAKLPVQHGNRREELGTFFDISGTPGSGQIRFTGDTRTIKHIAAEMTRGLVSVAGGAGMHAGAAMTGGMLVIEGDAGDWLGAEMRGGWIDVHGNAGNQTGAAYRGSRRGMTGGTIVVRGHAGDELGLLMRRGVIAVLGSCGEFAGASMIAGTVIAFGKLGARVGAGMKRGTILAAGGVTELPPSFRRACVYHPSFLPLFLANLRNHGLVLPGRRNDAVTCYRGDVLHGGLGEILV